MSSKQMGCGHTCQLHLQNTDISHVTRIYVGMTILKKGSTLYSSYVQPVAQSRVLCGPVCVFTVVEVSYILTTCPCFDNLEFDIVDAGGPQCHFITPVTIAVRIRTLSVY